MYMAEAQLYLDRIADAIRNLNADNVNDISLSLPDDKTEQGECMVHSVYLVLLLESLCLALAIYCIICTSLASSLALLNQSAAGAAWQPAILL